MPGEQAPNTNLTFAPGPSPHTVRAANGRVLTAPEGWILLPPGDAALTRRVKAAGEHWTVQEKKGRKTFSHGVWAPAAVVERIRAELETERSTEGYARRKQSDARRRDKAQAEYVEDFLGAVVSFLAFHPNHAALAGRLARAVTEHATPVGSGTVARTRRIPVEQRAEAAVIAWLRHHTTAYDSMAIPRVKGKRREVRRLLARRSKELLERYRQGEPIVEECPLGTRWRVGKRDQISFVSGRAAWAGLRLIVGELLCMSTEVAETAMLATSHSLPRASTRPRDAQAWQRLLTVYEPWLRGWLSRQELQPADAEDVLQDILVVVSEKLPQFAHNGQPGAFRAWLRMILTNRVRDFLRGRRNQQALISPRPLTDWLEQLTDPNSALSRQWDQEHDQQIVRRLLASIRGEFNPTTWQVFHMLVLQEHPVAEVAQRFGITANAVYVAKARRPGPVARGVARVGRYLIAPARRFFRDGSGEGNRSCHGCVSRVGRNARTRINLPRSRLTQPWHDRRNLPRSRLTQPWHDRRHLPRSRLTQPWHDLLTSASAD